MGKNQAAYALNGNNEFERLEHQSSFNLTSPERDFGDLNLKAGSRFLDAGCGSGLSSRYLASVFPKAQGIGCDFSDLILAKARSVTGHLSNLKFEKQDIKRLTYEAETFDLVICRYVLQHLSPENSLEFAKEAWRCLKKGGTLRLVDIDGLFYNIYPRSEYLDWALRTLEEKGSIDLRMGRKLSSLMHQAGFSHLEWRIDTLEYKDGFLQEEKKMATLKIESAFEYFAGVLGGAQAANRFKEEFCSALDVPGVALFYNKFVATGIK